jgi:hypothetical protein
LVLPISNNADLRKPNNQIKKANTSPPPEPRSNRM